MCVHQFFFLCFSKLWVDYIQHPVGTQSILHRIELNYVHGSVQPRTPFPISQLIALPGSLTVFAFFLTLSSLALL